MQKSIHRRNLEFREKIAKSKKNRVFGVAIDPSKEFHRAVIFNFSGKLLEEPFSFDSLLTGYLELTKKIRKATHKRKVEDVYVGVESAGIYSDALVRRLSQDFNNVLLINPVAVFENRKQKSLHSLKTDDIDAGSVGDLLIRGEFTKYIPADVDYYYVKELIHWREKRVQMRINLKNQVLARMDRLYPGLNSSFDKNERLYTPNRESRIYEGLLDLQKTTQELLETKDENLVLELGYQSTRDLFRVKKLKKRLNIIMPPSEEIARKNIELLKKDVRLLRQVCKEIKGAEKRIEEFARKSEGKYLIGQFKGVTPLLIGIYIGMIGCISKYESANHIFSSSGLSPKISESGSYKSKTSKITRRGSPLLRRTLFQMARQVIMLDDYFKWYYHNHFTKDKHWKKKFIAVANKLNRIMFAMIRDKAEFRRE